MESSSLSRKKKEELRKKKEEEDKIAYENFVSELDDLYDDLFSDEYCDFYRFYLNMLDKKFYCVDNDEFTNDRFREFVDKYSNHREDFKEEKIRQYLDYESSEEDDDEDNFEFLMKKTERI